MGANNRLRAKLILGKRPLVTSEEYIRRLYKIRKKILLDIKKRRSSKGFVFLAKQNLAYVIALIEREKEFLRWEKVWEESDGEIWIPAEPGFVNKF